MAFPVGTMSVNVSGASLLGLVTGLGLGHSVTTLLGTGFLGAYTTFSGWMLETRSLAEERRLARRGRQHRGQRGGGSARRGVRRPLAGRGSALRPACGYNSRTPLTTRATTLTASKPT